jgi:hypothetical protein
LGVKTLVVAVILVGLTSGIGSAASPAAPAGCAATRVQGGVVHAGPFLGLIDRDTDIVDGRFALRVGPYRDPASGLSQKILWKLPLRYRVGTVLAVTGRRIAPSPATFRQRLLEAYSEQEPTFHIFPSIIRPTKAGCWRLNFRTGPTFGSLVVLVRAH